MKEEFDSIRKKTIEQLKAGKPLLGKDDAFAPLLTSILNAALEGEKMHILQKKKWEFSKEEEMQNPLPWQKMPVCPITEELRDLRR